MADKKITQLNNITGANLADNDEFVVVNVSTDQTMAISRAQLFKSIPPLSVSGDGSFSTSGDTSLSVISTGTGDADATLVLDAADTGEAGVEFKLDGASKASIEWFQAGPDLNINTTSGTDGNIDFQPNESFAGRFTAAGKLGVGTGTPQASLHVNSGSTNSIAVFESEDAGATITLIDNNTTGGSTAEHGFNTVGNQLEIRAVDNLSFETGGAGSEAMRIDSSGNVCIGVSLLSDPSNGNGGSVFSSGSQDRMILEMGHSDTSSTARTMVNFYSGSGTGRVGFISADNDATAYNTSSDYRLKEDWVPMSGASERVQALNPVNFAWKSNGSRVDGFLAHEAQAVVPESVHGNKDAVMDEKYEVESAVYKEVVVKGEREFDGTYRPDRTYTELVTEAVMGTRSVPDYQGIDQSKLVPLLTAALQEALTRIAALEAAQ